MEILYVKYLHVEKKDTISNSEYSDFQAIFRLFIYYRNNFWIFRIVCQNEIEHNKHIH